MVKINFDYKKLRLDKIPFHMINKIPLAMIPLNKIHIEKIGKLFEVLIPKKDTKNSEIILNYIRIYTRLVNAYDFLTKES